MKYIVKRFDSVNEYSRYLNTNSMTDLFKKHGSECSKKNSAHFSGTSSWDEAEDLLRFGDKVNLKKLQAMSSKLNLRGTGESKKLETYRSFVGYAPHVPSYVSGQPKTMLRKKVVKTTNARVLNIMYSPCASAIESTSDMIKAAIEVMNFITGLEKQGYKVNLYTMIAATCKKESIAAIVRVKASDDYTDLAKVVYPMVNPSFLRRHFLRFEEVTDGLTEVDFCYGYGRPVYNKSIVEPLWKQLGIRIDYYFSYYEYTTQLKKYSN